MTLTFQPKRDAGFMPEPLTTPPTRSASRRRFTQRKAPFHPSITKLQSDRLLGSAFPVARIVEHARTDLSGYARLAGRDFRGVEAGGDPASRLFARCRACAADRAVPRR